MSFAEDLHQWQGFFTLLGEATASFAGLLFVALALNAERFATNENRHLMLLARQTFFNLMALTAISLLALAPSFAVSSTLGQALIAASGAGIGTCLMAIREEKRVRVDKRPSREYVRAYYGPAIMYGLQLIPAIRMVEGTPNNLSYVSAAAIALLLTSARNAWLLLFLPSK